MADLTLTARPHLGGYDRAFGTTRLTERTDLALISAACPLEGTAAFAAALDAAYGLVSPDSTRVSQSGAVAALRMTQDQLMLVLPDPQSAPDFASDAAVAQALQGAAYTTLQTDAWVILDLDGPLARLALERLCPLDLDPIAFPEGAQGRTVMEHMSAVVWRTGPQAYRLMSASSSADSFLHAVETSLTYVA